MYKQGDRIRVFDYRKYINDKVTPMDVTFLPATVIRQHNYKGDEVVDVTFDHDGRMSRCHFVWGVHPL